MPIDFFNSEEKKQIVDAIKTAEMNTSGEIRLHLEKKCSEDVLDRAAFLFEKLRMHETNLRNGVLFYLSAQDHKFAILGDSGINTVTPDNFWEEIKDVVIEHLKKEEYAKGLSKGIKMAGEALKQYFPREKDDVNELPDDISYGKK